MSSILIISSISIAAQVIEIFYYGDVPVSTGLIIEEMIQARDDCTSLSSQRINANDNAFAPVALAA